MDGFSTNAVAPPEYDRVKWLADLFVAGMGAGWIVHYVLVIHVSTKDQTYCLNIMALGADIAWEAMYSLIYPSSNPVEWYVTFGGMLLNLFVLYTASQSIPREWGHSPLVAQNASLVLVVTTAFWVGAHFAMAAQLGPALAYTWGAIACQLLISIGQIFQLLNRSSTRGASYSLWLSRFFGSTSVLGFWALRYLYWPEAFSWLGEPVIFWAVSVFFASELSYGYCFYRIRQQESTFQEPEHKRE